jgi:energy-coupling factor transport system permease protein
VTGGSLRPRRLLHPGAWWIWSITLAAAALRTTNPLLLGLVVVVVAFVVASRRSDAPWAGSFASFLRLGVIVIAIRVVFQILFGNRIPGNTLFTIPELTLPDWAAGVSIGGPVTSEAIVGAVYQGLRLAVVLACFGAAASLCSPYRLLRALPSALYEAGVAVTVALTFAPQAVIAARQVRDARRLRGRSERGVRAWAGSAMPVLEGALDRAVALAASMDSRGYGRHGDSPISLRRAGSVLTLVGIVCVSIGCYGILDPGAPALLRVPPLGLGAVVLVIALFLGGRSHHRSRYRPDPWASAEWIVALSGVAAFIGMVVAGRNGSGLDPSVYPLEIPTLPVAALIGILVAALPAWAAPLPPSLATVSVSTGLEVAA